MKLDLECSNDKFYINDSNGFKVGKIIKKDDYFNNTLKLTLLNSRREEIKLIIDKRLTNYIFYDISKDDFLVSKLEDVSELNLWLMYIFIGKL